MFLFKCLHSPEHHAATFRKIDKLFGDGLEFEDRKFPIKIKDIYKIKKKEIITLALVVLVMKRNKNVQSLCHKNALKKNMSIYH